jgi:hypothetical protein
MRFPRLHRTFRYGIIDEKFIPYNTEFVLSMEEFSEWQFQELVNKALEKVRLGRFSSLSSAAEFDIQPCGKFSNFFSFHPNSISSFLQYLPLSRFRFLHFLSHPPAS